MFFFSATSSFRTIKVSFSVISIIPFLAFECIKYTLQSKVTVNNFHSSRIQAHIQRRLDHDLGSNSSFQICSLSFFLEKSWIWMAHFTQNGAISSSFPYRWSPLFT